jgi:hypothetical protein
MAHFLRDQFVVNVTITDESIAHISSTFTERANQHNATAPQFNNAPNLAFVTYIIRFDNKGYRVFTLDELLQFYRRATVVERIIFSLETPESKQTARAAGTFMELSLDKVQSTNLLAVSSDSRDWVDASFPAVQDALLKCKNFNGWVRSAWTTFGVQIIGVIVIFLLCLWLAARIAPRLTVENAFVLSFFFLLLIFSNVWTPPLSKNPCLAQHCFSDRALLSLRERPFAMALSRPRCSGRRRDPDLRF